MRHQNSRLQRLFNSFLSIFRLLLVLATIVSLLLATYPYQLASADSVSEALVENKASIQSEATWSYWNEIISYKMPELSSPDDSSDIKQDKDKLRKVIEEISSISVAKVDPEAVGYIAENNQRLRCKQTEYETALFT